MNGEDEESRIRQHFARLAPEYDRYRTLDHAPLAYLAENLPRRDQRICDLGTGTGRYLIALIGALQAAGQVVKEAYGVDLSPEMLRVARQKAEEMNAAIEWREGDSHRTGIRPRSMTLVTAFNSIHWFPIRETLGEVERILLPEGILAIYTRIRERESEHVWGQWFPGYLDRSLAPRRQEMESLSSHEPCLRLASVQEFSFTRRTTFTRLCEQTRKRHYSTLDRFTQSEFGSAYSAFVESLRAIYKESDEITYPSCFSLFIYRLVQARSG
jgi:ubiquinone/menaquinone biosynthesis C-methylase UbiE